MKEQFLFVFVNQRSKKRKKKLKAGSTFVLRLILGSVPISISIFLFMAIHVSVIFFLWVHCLSPSSNHGPAFFRQVSQQRKKNLVQCDISCTFHGMPFTEKLSVFHSTAFGSLFAPHWHSVCLLY